MRLDEHHKQYRSGSDHMMKSVEMSNTGVKKSARMINKSQVKD